MTEFVIELLRLRGDESWARWGNSWGAHVELVGRLPSEDHGGWQLIDHFRDHGRAATKLDWGALLYAVSKQELMDLYSPSTELQHGRGAESEPRRLSELPEDDDYGLVVIEC